VLLRLKLSIKACVFFKILSFCSGLGAQAVGAPGVAGPARVPKRPGAMPPFALFSQVRRVPYNQTGARHFLN
jgi:hypothetical protein